MGVAREGFLEQELLGAVFAQKEFPDGLCRSQDPKVKKKKDPKVEMHDTKEK